MPPNPQPDWVVVRRRAIGDQIRAARIHANLTQQRVAETAGLDRPSLNRIEQGHVAPRIDTLIRIADAVGVPLATFIRQ
ncbi:helix-turn-helix transcriptional regulator [Streptomyces sp. A3M-1-3]|uniref:helix-turn-helix domain-containing protein n=1 Tax=Streptomyces sp. A3M-1-3 TaxID=2962044 RepID=UPI0027E56767|nr:helix-turn-helix transcriptional regulator [Streptomyces sp. A3M-1-3]